MDSVKSYIATAYEGEIKSDYERQWKQSGSTSSFNAWLLNDLKQNGIRRGTKYNKNYTRRARS